MDEIRIDNLEVYAYHGVYGQEKEEGQLFFLNVVLYTDTRRAGYSDELTHSVNYGEVCHKLTAWMLEEKCNLLERVAEKLTEKLLLEFQLIQGVDFEIRKPEAPIGLPFESVSVKIHRAWHKVYLSIGSNMGDKEGYLKQAIENLKQDRKIRNVLTSSSIETLPYGGVEQDTFLNGAVALETLHAPSELLDRLHAVEADAGRVREIHWGPRTLDLDILFYDKLIYEDENLIIPHVDMENRAFVLRPMCELAPNFRHPILGKTMQQLLEALPKEDR